MNLGWRERLDNLIAQISGEGVFDRRVLEAMGRVERHEFVPDSLWEEAYDNKALLVMEEQTISQPLMVGLMLQALDVSPGHRLLEVGAGTGYEAAILSELGAEVVTVERLPVLCTFAMANLSRCGYSSVTVVLGDGSLGYPDKAPYDRIILACAAPSVPECLLAQLKTGGRLVAPIGSRKEQILTIVERVEEGYKTTLGDRCYFVPMLGECGWKEERR